MDLHWFQCGSDPAFDLNADPDPNPDPDPGSQTNADQDPCQKKLNFYMKNINEVY